MRNPNQFLSAVQIGVTVAGFFSSAYGGSTIAPDLVPGLVAIGIPEGAAATVALVAMTLLIAYLSLVLGELVPKRLAMQRNLAFTRVLGPPLGVFAMLVRPVIWLLSVSTNAVMRLVGGSTSAEEEEMTPEEIRDLIEGHQGLHPYPRRILTDVFRAGDRPLARVLRPRTDIEFLAGKGLVLKVHGGATAVGDHPIDEPGFWVKSAMNPVQKSEIARTAASLIGNGQTIAVSAGTTAYAVAVELRPVKRLTVVTNSLSVGTALVHEPRIHLHLVGGRVRPRTLAAVGSDVEDQLRRLRAVLNDPDVVQWRETLRRAGGMPRFPLPLGDPRHQPERVEVREILDVAGLAAYAAHAREAGVSSLAQTVSVMTRITRELAGIPLRAVFPVHSRYDETWHDSVGWFITNSVLESRIRNPRRVRRP